MQSAGMQAAHGPPPPAHTHARARGMPHGGRPPRPPHLHSPMPVPMPTSPAAMKIMPAGIRPLSPPPHSHPTPLPLPLPRPTTTHPPTQPPPHLLRLLALGLHPPPTHPTTRPPACPAMQPPNHPATQPPEPTCGGFLYLACACSYAARMSCSLLSAPRPRWLNTTGGFSGSAWQREGWGGGEDIGQIAQGAAGGPSGRPDPGSAAHAPLYPPTHVRLHPPLSSRRPASLMPARR